MNAIQALVELNWDLRLAKMDSSVAVGYLVPCEEEVKHCGYLVLQGFADVSDFPRVFFDKLESPPSCPPETMAGFYTVVYN